MSSQLFEKYYLATSCRYNKPLSELHPFGDLRDCSRTYSEKYTEEYEQLEKK